MTFLLDNQGFGKRGGSHAWKFSISNPENVFLAKKNDRTPCLFSIQGVQDLFSDPPIERRNADKIFWTFIFRTPFFWTKHLFELTFFSTNFFDNISRLKNYIWTQNSFQHFFILTLLRLKNKFLTKYPLFFF